jgi:serine/threonine protein kinase
MGLGLSENTNSAGADPGRRDVPPLVGGKKAARSARILSDLGEYELLQEIGRGGQGVVYSAYQKRLNRTVALKVIGLGPWTTEAHLKRFRREAQAAASLEHPGIVPIHEVYEQDGQCYFSMKFVEGGQLDEVVRHSPMSIRQSAELVAKVARTVHYAHEHGILHRDLKPGNILLDKDGEPHLTDFGLARLLETESTVTRTLEVLGTPSYMAPEQAAGEHAKISKATDVYGLGAVLYQLLTGQPPFAGGTTYETIRLLRDTEPRQPRLLNAKIDRDLSTICLKCLEKDPQRRYSSAQALAEDLEHWLKHQPIRARRSGFFTRGKKWVQRNPSPTVFVSLLIALAAGTGVVVWKSELFRTAPERSIAVLPFENLSRNQDNAFFADGVQDEIRTDLGRVDDLKLIGPNSVMQYKSGAPRDLRKIGHELGVANVLEGSVERWGNHVRVNAQLVDARTERRLLQHSYDSDVADFFTIQSRIALAIAEELHVTPSVNEKSEIESPATKDITAFDLYARATQYSSSQASSYRAMQKTNLLQAENLLNESAARDPTFFRAFCQLAFVHDAIYFFGYDHTPARLALAKTALDAASRISANASELYLARAWNLYWGYQDYGRALFELEVARQASPNNPQILFLTGLMQRRRGYWEESTKTFERAAELDPRNYGLLQNIESNYASLQRYAEQRVWLGRILALQPDDALTKVILAGVDYEWKADTWPLHQND